MASRSPRGLGLTGTLVAQMSSEEFQLDFVLSDGEAEILRERVYRSEPSETSWHRHGFKKLFYEDGRFWIASTVGWSYKIDARLSQSTKRDF